MTRLFGSLIIRLRALAHRRAADAELDEELRYHLERQTERNVASGMSPAEARAAARRAFGNPTVHAERARDTMRWTWIEELRQDAGYAVRTYRRAPTFVVGVVATIGLGLGLLTTAFTLFDAYVLRPVAVRDPAALYESNYGLMWPRFQKFVVDGGGVFADVIGTQSVRARIRGQPMNGIQVTGNYFSALGVSPSLGRVIVRDDALPGEPGRALVLNYDTWLSTFGGDTSIIGRPLLVDGTSMTIVGVARRGFGGLAPVPVQFWVPITRQRLTDSTFIAIVGHIRPSLTIPQAAAKLRAWLIANSPPTLEAFARLELTPKGTAFPLDEQAVMVFAPVAAAFLLVMLTACANVANMMLARGLARQREIGIRLSLGAGRGRVVRQLLTEALLLSLPSAALALAVSRATIHWGMYALLAAMPDGFAAHFHVLPLDPDLRIFAFMIAAALGAAVAFGLLPAIQSTRPSVVRAARGDFDAPLKKSTLRGTLLFGQIAVSVLLLIVAGLLLRTAQVHGQIDPGFRTRNIVQFSTKDSASTAVLDRVRALREVRAVASASSPPMDGGLDKLLVRTGDSTVSSFDINIVSPDYFGVLDLPIVRGRNFTPDEARGRVSVAIVSQAAAATLWPGQDPLGHEVIIAPMERQRKRLSPYTRATVIGVAKNVTPGWVGRSPELPVVYYPQPVEARNSVLLVRVTNDALVAGTMLDRAVSAVDSSAIRDLHTIEQALAFQIYPYRLAYGIAWFVGGVALLLTIAGVYGVLSYLVAQRTREMGVRTALGASGGSLIALVLGDATRLAIVGTAAGAIAALGVSKLFAAVLVSIDVYDPIGYAIGVVVVLGATLAAAFVPARRAAAVNPVEALRADS